MASQHDDAPRQARPARHDGPGGRAPLAVVAELRRLVLGQHFGVAEQMLASLRDVGSPVTIDTLRQLCVSGAEQLRIASELDSAARAQRLLAQEVQQGIEAILASWERHITMAEEAAGALAVSSAPPDGKRRRRRWWAPTPGRGGPRPLPRSHPQAWRRRACRRSSASGPGPPNRRPFPALRSQPACSGRWT